MPKRIASEPAIQVAFRASPELVAAIDAEAERLRAERPGSTVNRSDVAREILTRALLVPLSAPKGGRAARKPK